MAFYKYGLAFLAGTGFGAAMASLRDDRCPLRRQHCHHRRDVAATERGERDEYYLREKESKERTRCPKKSRTEKKAGQPSYDKEEESD